MDGKDQDFFRIETPDGARELHVKLINKSTTLRPRIHACPHSSGAIVSYVRLIQEVGHGEREARHLVA